MSKTNPNDLATPRHWTETYQNGITHIHTDGGLTKREHFASMAMQGLIPAAYSRSGEDKSREDIIKRLTAISVEIADELINALNQESK